MNATKNFYTTKEVADLLGISRVTVYRWVKSGRIRGEMIGGSFLISPDDLPHHLLGGLSDERRKGIQTAVTAALKEYGETFRALARE